MRSRPLGQRGVSLIEALVALIVMTFGTLAVLGVQSALRLNSDTARQRAEAVRIAQETLERRRSFAKFDTGAAARFTDIQDVAAADVVSQNTNTTFQRREEVEISADPRVRTLSVTVEWRDRTNTLQSVRLTSSVFGAEPELAGSIGIPSDLSLIRNPRARHPTVPLDSVDLGNGSSEFTPPAAGGVTWIFNNATGYITSLCTAGLCTDANAWLLAGYVRFAVGGPPLVADAETPPSAALPVDVVVDQTAPTVQIINCYERLAASYVAYFCAVPVTVPSKIWSGRSLVNGLTLAASIADPDATRKRVCRYTPYRSHRVVPTGMSNAEHPLDYVAVNRGLTNQNFLVILAGDGALAFDCPDDDPATPFLLGTTWHHQPSL